MNTMFMSIMALMQSCQVAATDLDLKVTLDNLTGSRVTLLVGFRNVSTKAVAIDPMMIGAWCKIYFSDNSGKRVRYKDDLMGASYPDLTSTPIRLMPDAFYGVYLTFELLKPPEAVYVSAICRAPIREKPPTLWSGFVRSKLTRIK